MATETKDLYVVGIGASAGGLDAIQQLFDSIPPNTDMAFIIVQHLSLDFKSLMPELLAKHTSMKIYTAEDNQAIEPNCIYLNKGGENLVIKNGKLRQEDRDSHVKLNLPINVFFESLGNEFREKSIGIILSGTGSDGSKGIKTLKEVGGTIIVQEPSTAQFDGMLNSAINTNLVDLVLSPQEIGKKLEKISGMRIALNTDGERKIDDEAQFAAVLAEIYKYSGIDFRDYKKTTLARRLENRMNIRNSKNIGDYYRLLKNDESEKETLKYDFLIGVTSFFRDEDSFEILKKEVIPAICKKHIPGDTIRAWVAGCSTGQEAISIAILFDDYIRSNNLVMDFRIFATDINQVSLGIAANGVYDMSEAIELPAEYMENYFVKTGQQIKIIKRVRDKIVYSNHNLLKDPPFIRMDLVSCRNLLIYLDPRIQNRVIMNFQFALNTYGFLMLGSSESLGETGKYFGTIDGKWKIFQNTSDVKNLPVQVNATAQNGAILKTALKLSHRDGSAKECPESTFYKFMSQNFCPAAVFVDSDYNILFLTGDAGKKLTLPNGVFNNNLLKVINPEIVPIIRSGILRTTSEEKDVVIKNVSNRSGDEVYTFDLRFQKLEGPNFPGDVFAIVFCNELLVTDSDALVIESTSVSETAKARIEDLESELQTNRAEMQNLIEELEANNEEMQSANEELMSSNEELQSTNEELQSVNEELYTVNSELQEKNSELQSLYDDMDNLLNCTDIGTLFLDCDLNIRKFTRALTEHFNLQVSDIGRPISTFSSGFDETVRMGIINDSKKVLDKLITIEAEVKDKSGNNYLERINPYISSDKKIEGVVVTFVNTNNLKEMEKDLIMSENKFRNMFEYSPIGKYIMNLEGKLTVNKAFCDMLGYKKDEFKTWIEITYPDDIEETKKQTKLLESSDKTITYKKRFVRKNGEVIWGEVRAVTDRDKDGKPLNIISSVIDITERLEIEMEANRARQEAEISNMHKNYFMANMSHELRTPLNSVIGFTDMLKDPGLSKEESSQYLEIISDNANHLLNLINDIIDLAMIEADELKMDRHEVNVLELLNNLKVYYDKYKMITQKDFVKFALDVPSEVAELYINTDKERMRQVFVNLMNNALKFSIKNPSTITFGFSVKNDFVKFFVKDEGIGIPADKLDEIFVRFSQLNNGEKRVYGGTGLGLTICKGIVTSLGGRIWVESEEGKGSTFFFTLPLDVVEESKQDTKELRCDYSGSFAGKKIMIVDDDPSIQLYYQKIFEKTKATVFYPNSGMEALKLLNEIKNLDLVLLDLQMPEMSGEETFIKMKKLRPNLKVVAQTAYAFADGRAQCLSAGFTSYLVKPIKRDALFREVGRLLYSDDLAVFKNKI